MLLTLFAGLLPAALLVFHIYKADYMQPEPAEQIKRAIYFGIASIFVSMLFSTPFKVLGLFSMEYDTMIGALKLAFWGAGLPEELGKLIMLYLVVRNNPYFDEKMDGIVYAVCISMGFAGFENIAYVGSAGANWFGVSVSRALLAVPGHYYNGVFMGYFFAKYWFEKENKLQNLFWALAAPVIAHTLYDFILMYMNVESSASISGFLFVLLIFSCFQMLKWSRKRISEHLEEDARNKDGYQKSERSARDFYDRSDKV
jgi:RsiW-degrading membrane proteinase PrsW (M82 family)